MLPTFTFTSPTPAAPFNGTVSWASDPGGTPDLHHVSIVKPTFFGAVTVWSMVLPGTQTQVTLPPPALEKLRVEEGQNQLFVLLNSSRSPKFNYSQWNYEMLSGISWSAFTSAQSEGFVP
jgi:hypothetical protein